MKAIYYKTGVNISNTKEMWNFLHSHFTYYTLNSWNRLKSIANCVKESVIDGQLTCEQSIGLLDWRFSEEDNELNLRISGAIDDFEAAHPGYKCGFNGRSDGYLVLYSDNSMRNVLPDFVADFDTYEDAKKDLREWGYTVQDEKQSLRELVKLVRDFDKLCDKIMQIAIKFAKEGWPEK